MVLLNYNFIFTCVSMHGATINLQISPSCVCVNHVFSWRGTFTSRVIYHVPSVEQPHMEQPRIEQPCCNSHTRNTHAINMHYSIAINLQNVSNTHKLSHTLKPFEAQITRANKYEIFLMRLLLQAKGIRLLMSTVKQRYLSLDEIVCLLQTSLVT